MFCEKCGKDLKGSTVCVNCVPYRPNRPYPYKNPAWLPFKVKIIISLVFGVFSLWQTIALLIFVLIMIIVGGRFWLLIYFLLFVVGLTLTGLVLAAISKIPDKHGGAAKTAGIVFNSIPLGLALFALLGAIFFPWSLTGDEQDTWRECAYEINGIGTLFYGIGTCEL